MKERISINRTYAFLTHPVEKSSGPEEVMIWETKEPYLYLRTTKDGRIVSGGLDEKKDDLVEDSRYIEKKVSELY